MDIDFVVPWVDGSDPEWLKKFNQYSPRKKDLAIDTREERYRESGLLKYWFRGIEKYAPWARKIFFVTDNQKPAWLNTAHEKLVWVRHEDFIPREYLPVFSSHPINLNLHRIEGLSETFVYFNDDMYLINPIEKNYFFHDNLPRDAAILKCISPDYFAHIQINDLIEINKRFMKKDVLRRHFGKFFNGAYSPFLQGMSLFFSLYPVFLGFYVAHTPQPFLKKTFEEVWEHCGDILRATSSNRFRNIADVNQYLFKYWQIVTGNFAPVNLWKTSRYLEVRPRNMRKIEAAFHNPRVKELCLNDTACPPECYAAVERLFARKLPGGLARHRGDLDAPPPGAATMTIMTTGLPINLSSSVYERFIKGGFLYVDKTLFIEHFLEDASDVLLIPRPRRMGKSLNMNTLAAYLDVKRETGPLFEGKRIEDWSGFRDHLNRYPVVYMDFNLLMAEDYKQALRNLLMEHVRKYLGEEKWTENIRTFVEDRCNTAPRNLLYLTANLHEAYGEPAIILIDEYDHVLMDNVGKKEYEEIRNYISAVFETALKGNAHLYKALLTGVLRVSQESMFSKLNNIKVYDVFTPSRFDEDFGLTEEEVHALVPAENFAKVKEWYNNVHVGNSWMFYIYSLLSYLDSGRVGDYWGQTGTMELLADQITPARAVKIGEALKELGASFPAAVDPQVSLRQFFRNEVDEYYYAVAIQAGYLTFERDPVAPEDSWPRQYLIRVPNQELLHVWKAYILSRIVNDPRNRLEKIFAEIDKQEFFDQDLAEFISFKLSCFDLEKDHDGRPGGALEKTYHVFVFGMLLTLGYECRSNREAGFGRFDIFIEAPQWTAALEFKTAEDKAGLESAAREGLKQIHDREYLAEADKGKSAYAIGVGCWKEKCVVITERVW